MRNPDKPLLDFGPSVHPKNKILQTTGIWIPLLTTLFP